MQQCNDCLFQIAVRRRRSKFHRVSRLSEFKLSENEVISGVQCSYAPDGEQTLSFETCDKSNADKDKSSETQQEETIDDSQSVTKEFQGDGDRCIESFTIIFIK